MDLPQSHFLNSVMKMSAVEVAVRKVKKLYDREARELLGWLDKRRANGTAPRRKSTARRSMRKLKAWQDLVRFTTDWQPPRMPGDLVKPTRL